ncbi:sialidase family protein [Sulfurisoma sediminicola]|uniref:Putative neuraminidase n=1 Tax=Sulfurisoma sediminicola TaxID=1381557 RepID=A0A497XE76_9PROT|nr:sialidase family protein [Sulfurisoma sediminicola]RLJ65281.1 putative neuraminidase [Sulfurisoma sediminicola]
MKQWLAPLALAVALAAAWPRLQPPTAARFTTPAAAAPAAQVPSPAFSERLLANPQPSAHAATLAELPDGRIAAAWFAGSAEGARDVAIFLATFDGRQWSETRPIVTRAQAQRDTARLVRKLGNPVLASDDRGRLHLWFVSVGYGGWAGSAINHVASTDGGRNWSEASRLITSPFWNLSTLVRTPPMPLADGGWGLPAYHEFAAKRAEWLRLDAQGRVLDKARLPGAARTLQPAVAALDGGRAVAMMRDAGPANRIPLATTQDAGATWQAARATALANPNASVALLHLADGRLLLAWNPQTANRDKLALSLSRDAGATWSAPKIVEDSPGGEFSYPALLQGRDGTIHLAYTWQRKTIKHLAFSPAWLEAGP